MANWYNEHSLSLIIWEIKTRMWCFTSVEMDKRFLKLNKDSKSASAYKDV